MARLQPHLQPSPSQLNSASSGLSHPNSPALSKLQDLIDDTASLPVSVYNGAKHEGDIGIHLSSIARDTNTFTSGTLLRGAAAKEYIEGVSFGQNPQQVLGWSPS
jgi:hypothetical protein